MQEYDIKIQIRSKGAKMNNQIPSLAIRMPCLNPVYPEGYDENFMEVKNRIEREDYSSETNDLIQKVLTYGQTNYTCWVAKKRIFQAGNTTIEHQDKYSIEMLLDQNFKNFQLWDFRNFVSDVTGDYQKQYDLMDVILTKSPKNYHLWSNRTRLVSKVKNFQQQISRTQKILETDLYNNSAWAYRAFCFKNLAEKNYKEEIKYVITMILKYVDNQAAWNYLRGMFPCYKIRNIAKIKENKQTQFQQYQNYPQIKELCNQIVQNKQNRQTQKIQALFTLLIIDSHNSETVQYAKQVCAFLAELEPMRANFYNWLKQAL